MKRSLVLLNLALLGITVLLGYFLIQRWGQFDVEQRLALLKPGSQPLANNSDGSLSPLVSSSFAPIVDHHLFNLDRNNRIPQESKAPPEQVVLGPIPILMGTVGISDSAYALMIPSKGSNGLYRRIKVGEALDGYTLVSIEMDRVVMKAGGTEVKVGINKPRKTSRSARTARSARRRVTAVGSRSRGKGASAQSTAASGSSSHLEGLPVGTVKDGKRLVAVPSPFGEMRTWVKEK
mgnify:CR=1 FL=1